MLMINSPEACGTATPDGYTAKLTPDRQIVTYEETVRCPACEGLIDAACVTSELLPSYGGPTRQRVCVLCDHCQRGFSGVYGFCDGRRVQLMAVSNLDTEDLQKLREHAAGIRGDRQQTSVAGEPDFEPATLDPVRGDTVVDRIEQAHEDGEVIEARDGVEAAAPACDVAGVIADQNGSADTLPLGHTFDPSTSQIVD
jgi:hypothetical protein